MIIEKIPDNHGVIIFDGYCVLCSATVAFLSRIDRRKKFLYTIFDSQTYKNLSLELTTDSDSIVLLMDSGVYLQSEAVLKIVKELGLPWSLLAVAKHIPFKIRENLYRWIAKHRYKIFGRKDSCGIPEANVRNRLLE